MKKKILGVLIFMLLLATIVIPANALNNFSKRNIQSLINNSKTLSTDVNVPVWKVGNSWTYEVDYYEGGIYETMNCSMLGNLVFTVADDTGDHYLLKAKGKLNGLFKYGKYGLKTTRFITAGTDILVRKSDLGLENWYLYLRGIFVLIIENKTLPIPIQLSIERSTKFNPTWAILPFPLYDGKSGVIDSIDIIQEGSVSLFWGLKTLSDRTSSWISEELYYTCYEEQITVPAGNYSVYNISAENPGYYEYYYYRTYYAPEVGNFAKESVVIPFNPDYSDFMYLIFNLELKSTNYTP